MLLRPGQLEQRLLQLVLERPVRQQEPQPPLVAPGRGWPRRLARATLLLRLEQRCCGCCAALECAG